MVIWILAVLGLYMANVYLSGLLLFSKIGVVAYTGPRDTLPEDGVLRARSQKALTNLTENLPVFIVLAMLAMIVEGTNLSLAEQGAQVFLLARVLYLPVYLVGVPFIRSLIFTAGLVGLGIMAYALF